MDLKEAYSWQFTDYVGKQQSDTVDANSCDYKGTSQRELAGVSARAREGFERAKHLAGTLTPPQVTALRALSDRACQRERFSRPDDFCSFSLQSLTGELGYLMHPKLDSYVGPRWLSHYDEYRALVKIIEPSLAK